MAVKDNKLPEKNPESRNSNRLNKDRKAAPWIRSYTGSQSSSQLTAHLAWGSTLHPASSPSSLKAASTLALLSELLGGDSRTEYQ